MHITIKTYQANAIRMGRNSTEWTTDIDITALTPEQRVHLAGINNVIDLCDATGEITAESIQAHIDAQKEKEQIARLKYEAELAETIAKCTAAVQAYETGGDYPENMHGLPSNHPLYVRREHEQTMRINEWETKIGPEVAAYLAGGPRYFPSWIGRWAGTDDTFAIIQEEDNRRSEQNKIDVENRKIVQLTEVVNRLGTDVQREKWAAGLMAHSEALNMLWRETFPGNALPADKFHLEKIEGYKRCETEKNTLTDEQFVAAQKIIATVPDATAAYYHQYYDAADEMEALDLLRLKKTVGEYTLEADYII